MVLLDLSTVSTWPGVSRSEAIYYAEQLVDILAEVFYEEGIPYSSGNGTVVYVDYELKQKDGSTVKTWKMEFGKDYYQVH